jgi:hemerythrin superfamily protein
MATRAKKKTTKKAKSARGRTSGRRGSTRSGGRQSSRARASADGRRANSGNGRGAQRSQSGTQARSRSRAQDALALLRSDHQRVQQLFERFERTRGEDQKNKLAEQICADLELHARLEEELFYPAVRDAIRETDLVDEAEVEHQSAKDLIRQIQKMSASDEKFDATVKVLGEYVRHHIKEEEKEMFPQARGADLDLAELGQRMSERRGRLSSSSILSRLLPG